MKKLTLNNLSRPVVIAVLVFIITAFTGATLVWRLEKYRLVEARTRVSSIAVDHAVALQIHMERAFSAAYALAALVRQGNGTVNDFSKVALEMLPFYPGVAALALVPDGVVKDIVPLAGNEAAIGHDLLKDPLRDKEAFLARDTGRLTLAGPFNLVQGGLGAIARLPVFLDNPEGQKKFWGFTAVLIRFPETLAPANLSQLADDGLAYELWRINPDTKQKQIIAASSSLPVAEPVQQSLKLPNGVWTLSIAPAKGWGSPLTVLFQGFLGLLFSLLLAWFVKLLVESKKQEQILEGLVDKRTADYKESEERLRLVGDNLPNSYIYQYIHDDDSKRKFIQVSAGVERVHGVSCLEVLQDADVLIRQVDPEQLPFLWTKENISKDNMSDFYIKLRLLRPDGEWRWLQLRSHPRKRPDGQVFWDGVATDITDEKKVEEELEAARNEAVKGKRYLEVIMEVLPVGLAICNTDGQCIRTNPTFNQIWAGSDPSVDGKACPVYKAWFIDNNKQLLPDEWASIRAMSNNEKIVGQLLKIERFDGSQTYIHNSAAPFHDSGGKVAGCVIAVMDINEQIQARETLQQAKEAAESANLAKSQFLANMSHELRTPMTSILGMIQLSLEEDVSPVIREYLETTLHSARSLLRILNDILDMTNIVGGRLSIINEPFSLRTCVSEAINIVAPEARRKGLAVVVSIDDVPDRVLSDQVRIRQILVNLVSNAVKFTRQGKVEVKLTCGRDTRDKLKIIFMVSDTGIGIPEDKQQTLFQAFSQVEASHSRSFGGVGLGLFISKEIVKLLGGSISFESHEGMGSTFCFTIPVEIDMSQGEIIPAAADSAPITSVQRMPHLLLAEDDPSIRQLLGQILRRSNFDLDIAEDGVEAVEKWEKGDYELLLMDVQMPRMDGFEATRAIRKKEQERGGYTAIIAMTAHAQKEDVTKCLDAGMDAYVSKPIDFKKTIDVINENLEKRHKV